MILEHFHGEISERFEQVDSELSSLFENLMAVSTKNRDKTGIESSFYIGLIAHFLSSAVMA